MIFKTTEPRLQCYQDPSQRNVIADLSNVLLCGWRGCNGEFFDYELFTMHVDTHAMEDITIPVISKDLLKTVKFAKCEWCGCEAAFKSKSHLKSHLMSHTQKKLLACPVCGLAFCTKTGFLNHCYRQDTPTSVNNSCWKKMRTSKSKTTIVKATEGLKNLIDDELEGGMLTIDDDDDNDVEDEELSEVDSSKSSTLVNTQRTETQQPSFSCLLCPKSFVTKSLLREHANKHVRRYQCSRCSYAAPYPARLKEHETYRHSERRDYTCNLCEAPYKTPASLRRHEQTAHPDAEEDGGPKDEANVCKVCHTLFRNYYSLNRHIRLAHLNEQIVFACHLCSKAYNRGNNLSRHLTGAHSLRPANGWSKFVYEKEADGDGIFRLKLLTANPLQDEPNIKNP